MRNVPKGLAILYCSLTDASSPLRPILDHFERDIEVDPSGFPDERAEQVRRYLDRKGIRDPDAWKLLVEILIPEARIPRVSSPPEERRRRAMDLLCRLLVPDDRPALLIVEDMHWADPSTAELLGIVVERLADRPTLAIVTTRPEFSPTWSGLPSVTIVDLPSLDATFTAELATAVAGVHLPREGQALILNRSGGVPLFVEELTRMVLDAGLVSIEAGHAMMRGRIIEESVPGTVYDLLVARIGRLGDEAQLAQLAAVLGNEFTSGFLRAITPEESDLDGKLARLVELGVVERRGELGAETFRFSHTLVRDAAYGLLLRKRRRELHGRVADVLVRDFPETVEAHPEIAAPHFTESGRVAEAIEHWTKAGRRAVEQYALHEAIDHYTRAIELVRGLPGSPERARREIELSFALGPAIQNVTGFGDPRVDDLYGRIGELSHWLESDVERFTFLAYGYAMNMVRANYGAARATAEQMMEVASRSESTSRKLLALCSLGTTLFQLGEIVEAMPLIHRAIEMYDPVRHERLIVAAAIDPGVVAMGYRAWGEWHLGAAESARATMRELLELIEKHPHPFRTATALVWAAGLAQRLREPAEAAGHADTALRLATEHGYEELERYAMCLKGWSVATAGDPHAGAEIIRTGLALVPHGGSRAHYSWHMSMLAEAELLAGDPEAARRAVAAAKAFGEETGERVFEAELSRLEAEIGLATGATRDEVDAALRAAIDEARRRSGLPFELRATAARHRLHGSADTRRALEACYASFTEGLETADLVAARELLAAKVTP